MTKANVEDIQRDEQIDQYVATNADALYLLEVGAADQAALRWALGRMVCREEWTHFLWFSATHDRLERAGSKTPLLDTLDQTTPAFRDSYMAGADYRIAEEQAIREAQRNPRFTPNPELLASLIEPE